MSGFVVIIPARLGATRLPRKPLADIGGLPMIVRVARNAAASQAQRVIVAADSEEILAACAAHEVDCQLTSQSHATGTDRLAEVVRARAFDPRTIVVNVQGDEPLLPPAVIDQVARTLERERDCEMATAAHSLHDAAEFFSPHVVKVVVDARGHALYFSRAPIPWSREAFAHSRDALPAGLPALRHVGLYAYRASFLLRFADLAPGELEQHEALEQLRALASGVRIAVLRLAAALPPGVDTAEDLKRVRTMLRS